LCPIPKIYGEPFEMFEEEKFDLLMSSAPKIHSCAPSIYGCFTLLTDSRPDPKYTICIVKIDTEWKQPP